MLYIILINLFVLNNKTFNGQIFVPNKNNLFNCIKNLNTFIESTKKEIRNSNKYT